MKLYEKKLQRIFYVLYDTNGDPRTGLGSADLIFRYAKATDTDYTVKTLIEGEEANFGELGYGFYWTDLTETETNIIGSLAITITTIGPGPSSPSPLPEEIDSKHITAHVEPYPIVPGASISLCTINGSVKDLGGEPTSKPLRVTTQIIKLPAIIDGNFISTRVKDVYTDEDGVFKMKLAVGATVRVEIKDAGVRRQFIVPDQETANLKDLPEPTT